MRESVEILSGEVHVSTRAEAVEAAKKRAVAWFGCESVSVQLRDVSEINVDSFGDPTAAPIAFEVSFLARVQHEPYGAPDKEGRRPCGLCGELLSPHTGGR